MPELVGIWAICGAIAYLLLDVAVFEFSMWRRSRWPYRRLWQLAALGLCLLAGPAAMLYCIHDGTEYGRYVI